MDDVDTLVAAARKGDRGAFNKLVESTYADAYTLAYRLTGNDADACDVVQDAYVRAFKSIAAFRGDAKFSTWLYRITANCASTHMSRRRRDRHEVLADDEVVVDTAASTNPEFSVDNSVLHGDLVAALEGLPKHMREVVVLRDVYDLTHDAIANELGISVTAAKVRLHRARKLLRNVIDRPTRGGGRFGNASAAIAVEPCDTAHGEEPHAV